jgi:hypothetical protein
MAEPMRACTIEHAGRTLSTEGEHTRLNTLRPHRALCGIQRALAVLKLTMDMVAFRMTQL